jgi:hypothetical protein
MLSARQVEQPGTNPVIDHCHKTDVVRGTICATCNSVLGFIRDDVATAYRLAEYLERLRSSM